MTLDRAPRTLWRMRGNAMVLACVLAACGATSPGPTTHASSTESPEAMDAGAPVAPPPSTTVAPADPAPPMETDAGPPPTPDAGPTPAPLRTDLPEVGPALAAATADDTEVDGSWNSFLTNHPRPGECAIDTPLSWLHEDCRPVRPTRVSTSAADATTLVRAFDLDGCTSFTAGDAPQVVEIELARRETLDLIVIEPGAASSGPSRHVVETPDRRGRWVPRTTLFGAYYDGVLYALRFPEPITTQRLRIRTIASPGPIEIREIVPVACEGEVAIHVEGIPPDPEPTAPVVDWHDAQYTHVTGSGHCRHDADCAPMQCCGGSMCGLASDAPNCSQVGCPQSCGSPLSCGAGACICFHGMCSLATRYGRDAIEP